MFFFSNKSNCYLEKLLIIYCSWDVGIWKVTKNSWNVDLKENWEGKLEIKIEIWEVSVKRERYEKNKEKES